MSQGTPRRGMALMVLACLVFAGQDALSRHLAEGANVLVVVMVRYWFLAAFVVALARARGGSVRAVARTPRPWLQAGRGLLLAGEICVTVWAFTLLGLGPSHAVFAAAPLLIVALSGPVLGERVGPWRWAAVAAGFGGILLILAPGTGTLGARALVPLAGAAMWALYQVLTRMASRTDSTATSFFWTGAVGAAAMTVAGLWSWEPLPRGDWPMMAALCVTGALGHWLLIRAYDGAEASALQPFAYLQLVFATAIGAWAFGERVEGRVILGAAVVVGAGLSALWRERRATASGPAREGARAGVGPREAAGAPR